MLSRRVSSKTTIAHLVVPLVKAVEVVPPRHRLPVLPPSRRLQGAGNGRFLLPGSLRLPRFGTRGEQFVAAETD